MTTLNIYPVSSMDKLQDQVTTGASLGGILLLSDTNLLGQNYAQPSSLSLRRVAHYDVPMIHNSADTMAARSIRFDERLDKLAQVNETLTSRMAAAGASELWDVRARLVSVGGYYTSWLDSNLPRWYRTVSGVWMMALLACVAVLIVNGQGMFLGGSALAIIAVHRSGKWMKDMWRTRWS